MMSFDCRFKWTVIASTVIVVQFAFQTGVAQSEKLSADQVLDPNRLLEIQITLPPDDWQKIRSQSRSFGADFNDKPFTYVKGDISIDGVQIESVGIRKKGFFGSMDSQRPSLKIKFDEYVKQKPIDGLSRLTLNNNKQDLSQTSQLLTYSLFNAAGLHAPRCNLARVTVNGEYLGIYSNVEAVKKPFLKRHFGDSSGNLYEGTIADFYPKAVSNIEAKTNEDENDRSKIKRLAELLASEEDLDLDDVGKLIDIDRFLRFWALESLIAFWDGYGNNQNNYFLYENPGDGKLAFIPWGADSCFDSFQGPFGRFGGNQGTTAVYSQSMLTNRLYHVEGIPARYRRVMSALLDEVWIEDKLTAEVDRIEKLVADQLHDRQLSATRAANNMRQFIRTRRQQLVEELKDWPAPVRAAPRKPSYTVKVGSARGSFSTTWREETTLTATEAGSAKLQLELGGKTITVEQLEVRAQPGRAVGFGRGSFGSQPTDPPATVVFSGVRSDTGVRFTLTLSLDRDAYVVASGKTIAVRGSFNGGGGGGFGFGFAGRGGPSVRGEVKFAQASAQPGEPVTGELNVQIVETRGGFFGGNRGAGPPPRKPDPAAAARSERLQKAVELFKKVDVNQDGKIQQQEWKKTDQPLAAADTNADEVVSLRELIEWLKQHETSDEPQADQGS